MNALSIILIVVALIVGAGIGIFAGSAYRKKVAEAEIGSAEQEAKRIVSDAMKTAEAKKKEAILEGKDEVHQTAARRYSARSAVSSRRKKPSTASSIMSRKRKRRLTRRSKKPRGDSPRRKQSRRVSLRCSRGSRATL